MAKLLSNLKEIYIRDCGVIEEVVSNRDDEDEGMTAFTSTNTSTNLFPHLDILRLNDLHNLTRIGGGGSDGNEIYFGNANTITPIRDQFKVPQADVVLGWCLCQYFRDIDIQNCDALSSVVPSNAVGQMQKLEKLEIWDCKSLVEVFETKGINSNTNIDEGSGGANITFAVPRLKCIDVPQLSSLKTLEITRCNRLEHVFTFSALESLVQLQQLMIRECKTIEVIVKEEHGEIEATMTSVKVVVFPRLEYIELQRLPNVVGFFLGTNEFHCPSLEDVMIKKCSRMKAFTSGHLIAPKLKCMDTSFGKLSLECGLDNFHGQNPLSCLDGTGSCPAASEGCPWSSHNMIEMDLTYINDVKKVIPCNKLPEFQKLEKICVTDCELVEEIFEAPEGPDCELRSGVVKFLNLRDVDFCGLENLKHIWKNTPWMVLEFPNLTTLSVRACTRIQRVFTSSTIGRLPQLQVLFIYGCDNMEVIVEEEEEECDGKVNEIITLPRLKSLTLSNLPSLKGFYLGNEAFSWPSLDTLEISRCPAITIFTMGHSTTPQLQVIDTRFGLRYVGEDLNSFIKTAQEKGLQLGEEEDS